MKYKEILQLAKVMDTSSNGSVDGRRVRRRLTLDPNTPVYPNTSSWEEITRTPPAPGTIRILEDISEATSFFLDIWWFRDRTFTEWVTDIDKLTVDMSSNPIMQAVYPPNYIDLVKSLFERTQRERFLARWAINRWRSNVWKKRTVCNVDLVDLQQVRDADAIFLTDMSAKQIYRFHRNDVAKCMMANLGQADELLPTPRAPTNPWTNAPLTLWQTMTLCQQLLADYGRRGICPPVLFSAFWAARFDIKRFEKHNASMLSQMAIMSHFADINAGNIDMIEDTMTELLERAGCAFNAPLVRRWIRAPTKSQLHDSWRIMCRDYTIYINLHVQMRAHWYTHNEISADVRRLWNVSKHAVSNMMSQRMRLISENVAQPPPGLNPSPLVGLLGLPILWNPPQIDLSGGQMDVNIAIELIQQAMFRF